MCVFYVYMVYMRVCVYVVMCVYVYINIELYICIYMYIYLHTSSRVFWAMFARCGAGKVRIGSNNHPPESSISWLRQALNMAPGCEDFPEGDSSKHDISLLGLHCTKMDRFATTVATTHPVPKKRAREVRRTGTMKRAGKAGNCKQAQLEAGHPELSQ